MPKIKTNRSSAKRFSRTAKGKIKRRRSFARHLMGPKSNKRKRHMRKSVLLSHADEGRVSRLIPYA
ncbi:MAG: 50S ribosomal protein L35 [candidate division Zixibacteria bacterium]|nr:50S ribosomal protein L35 [candidate division Zixibacteria bacterium]